MRRPFAHSRAGDLRPVRLAGECDAFARGRRRAAGQMTGQLPRLIESAVILPSPVERNGHDIVSFVEQLDPAHAHQACDRTSQRATAAVLERMNNFPQSSVVFPDGSRSIRRSARGPDNTDTVRSAVAEGRRMRHTAGGVIGRMAAQQFLHTQPDSGSSRMTLQAAHAGAKARDTNAFSDGAESVRD